MSENGVGLQQRTVLIVGRLGGEFKAWKDAECGDSFCASLGCNLVNYLSVRTYSPSVMVLARMRTGVLQRGRECLEYEFDVV